KKDGLAYLKTKLGLDESAELILGSPFDYANQVRLYLTRKMPEPNDKEAFEPVASEKILKYLKQTQDRAFVLFTSYDLMNRIYERLNPVLETMGLITYKQGKDLSRHQMLEQFKNQSDTLGMGSVIFGADSFWQGVDVPGPALENVIITKLPFPVPTSPLVEAKIEQMERTGIDSFINYFIPEAVIRLRQGFGRLIRTRTDKGIVVILDNRIITRQYGRFFLESLPECEIIIEE
ncbi:unnamed protein product, partial [marine sediment metagenome]